MPAREHPQRSRLPTKFYTPKVPGRPAPGGPTATPLERPTAKSKPVKAEPVVESSSSSSDNASIHHSDGGEGSETDVIETDETQRSRSQPAEANGRGRSVSAVSEGDATGKSLQTKKGRPRRKRKGKDDNELEGFRLQTWNYLTPSHKEPRFLEPVWRTAGKQKFTPTYRSRRPEAGYDAAFWGSWPILLRNQDLKQFYAATRPEELLEGDDTIAASRAEVRQYSADPLGRWWEKRVIETEPPELRASVGEFTQKELDSALLDYNSAPIPLLDMCRRIWQIASTEANDIAEQEGDIFEDGVTFPVLNLPTLMELTALCEESVEAVVDDMLTTCQKIHQTSSEPSAAASSSTTAPGSSNVKDESVNTEPNSIEKSQEVLVTPKLQDQDPDVGILQAHLPAAYRKKNLQKGSRIWKNLVAGKSRKQWPPELIEWRTLLDKFAVNLQQHGSHVEDVDVKESGTTGGSMNDSGAQGGGTGEFLKLVNTFGLPAEAGISVLERTRRRMEEYDPPRPPRKDTHQWT